MKWEPGLSFTGRNATAEVLHVCISCRGDAMSVAPAVKRELELEACAGGAGGASGAGEQAGPQAPQTGRAAAPPPAPAAAARPARQDGRHLQERSRVRRTSTTFFRSLTSTASTRPGPPPPALPAPPQPRPASPARRASDEESGGTPRRLSPDSARRARDAAFQPDVLRRLGVVNPEAFCEICCKEYCNKYFLKTHRERRHGVPAHRSPTDRSPSAASPPRAPSLPPLPSPRGLSPPTPLHVLAPPSLRPPLKAEEPDVKRECDDEMDMPRDGQTSPLNLIMEERGGDASPGSASEELRKLQTMISQLNELAAERLADTDGAGPGENGLQPRDSRPPSASPPPPDERRGSGGSSFCEICNKELCNKYFMRTHMQRMHGISLESGTQLGGVTCDICHKELCSKYFLRVHKHNTHGIPAPPAPQAPSPSEPCPLCARRFRGPRALRAHLLAEHAPPARPPPPPPRPLDLLARDKPYACSFCPFTTDVLAFLFAHERAHAQQQQHEALEPSEMPQELPMEASERPESHGEGVSGGAMSVVPEPEDNGANDSGGASGGGSEASVSATMGGLGQYECSRCEFRAREFGALEAHLRAAHGGGGALLAVPRAQHAPLTMQPFVVEEAAAGGLSLVPALVFLPVRRRATRRATVTLTLTPA
ncbi:hypothetical protein EVAR_3696_1 [Eumeta japonica]|uniref:C2H2-type domain-containing protein n=1 Tax=Eumeta variegata TaxID=151549 RepID=A0A4C1SRA2_EUMVA|nr:hypothetical protein EVAR_3696_1 [Eumeta japonica]